MHCVGQVVLFCEFLTMYGFKYLQKWVNIHSVLHRNEANKDVSVGGLD